MEYFGKNIQVFYSFHEHFQQDAIDIYLMDAEDQGKNVVQIPEFQETGDDLDYRLEMEGIGIFDDGSIEVSDYDTFLSFDKRSACFDPEDGWIMWQDVFEILDEREEELDAIYTVDCENLNE